MATFFLGTVADHVIAIPVIVLPEVVHVIGLVTDLGKDIGKKVIDYK